MEEKNNIRKEVRAKIKQMYGWEKDYYGKQILQAIEANPLFQQAQTILLYWSLPDEINTHLFINRWSKEKTILLPVVIGDDSEIRIFQGEEKLAKGAFNIDEPIGEAYTNYHSIDLAIVPGMAFDKNGNRLGRGKGYYDKLLSHLTCPKIGICFPCQIFPSIPHEEWDERMNQVQTASL